MNVRDPVRARQELSRDADRVGDAGPRIGTDIDRHVAAQSEDRAVAAAGHLDGAGNITGVVDGQKVLAAVLDPFDRALEAVRGEGDQEVLGIEIAADTKSPADVALDQVDVCHIEPQHRGERAAVLERHLGRAVQDQFVL